MIGHSTNRTETPLRGNPLYFGEAIEKTVSRIFEKGEIAEVDEQRMYTEGKEGVIAETDIRSDKFDMALDAVIKAQRTVAQAKEKAKESEKTQE